MILRAVRGFTVGQCELGHGTGEMIDQCETVFHIAVCWEAVLNGTNHMQPGETKSAWHSVSHCVVAYSLVVINP
jgi:hypothetical protein